MVRTARSEATRTALGPTLVRLCREGLDIVCIDADLGYSTSAVKFGQEFPERFFPVGVVTGEDGASAEAIEDLALMLSIPTFRVIFPADVVEAEQAIETAARTEGPFYMRTLRPKTPVIYDDSGYRFQLGRWDRLRDGSDVTLIACGELVKAALDAAEILAGEGI